MAESYESVALVKNEVFVYRIPPVGAGGYRYVGAFVRGDLQPIVQSCRLESRRAQLDRTATLSSRKWNSRIET